MKNDDNLIADVSRETLGRLVEFADILTKWNRTINLVSKKDMEQLWERHIWDSAQIYHWGGMGALWVDIGSGGGFPGLVVAILAKEFHPTRSVVLIESDQRKAAFLRTAVSQIGLNTKIIAKRVEDVNSLQADVLSARALSHTKSLIHYADRHLARSGVALLMKGESWPIELAEAQEAWSFKLAVHKSKTNPAAAILEIRNIASV